MLGSSLTRWSVLVFLCVHPCHRTMPASGACPVQRLAELVEARLERGGRLGRYTLDQVAQHNTKDNGWIVVGGKVRGVHRRALAAATARGPSAATVAQPHALCNVPLRRCMTSLGMSSTTPDGLRGAPPHSFWPSCARWAPTAPRRC